MNTMAIFGVNESAATRALAETLWATGPRGKVFTGCGTCAAHFHKSHDAWVLHNAAWWGYGGAHNLVREAADILVREAPEFGKPEGELTLVGHTLTCVSDEGGEDRGYHNPSPCEAAIWDVAGASHRAWCGYQAVRRIEREAQEAGLPVPVFRLVRGGWGFGLDREFAVGFVEKFGDNLAVAAVDAFSEAVFNLQGDAGPDRAADHPCINPYGNYLTDFGRQYLASLFYTEGHMVCDPDTRKSRFEAFGLRGLSEFVTDYRVDGVIDALETLLEHYGLDRSVAQVYNG